MRYILLIHDDDAEWDAMTDDERAAIGAEFGAFNDELRTAGALVVGNELQPASTATVVSVRHGGTVVTDGPFAETKEAFGGFFLFEADDLDAALELAARIPAARRGGAIEVRPVVER
jgi:hypothetical protein